MPSRAITCGVGGPAGSRRDGARGRRQRARRGCVAAAEGGHEQHRERDERRSRRGRRAGGAGLRARFAAVTRTRDAPWGRGGDIRGHRSEPPRRFNRSGARRGKPAARASRSPGQRGGDAQLGERGRTGGCTIGRVSAACRRAAADPDPALDPAGRPAAAAAAAWVVATAAGHVVFLFLVAALIALLLDPLVRALERFAVPAASRSRSCT